MTAADHKSEVPCDERHYIRFLRRVLPGPERTLGEWACDACGMYFDEQFRPLPLPETANEKRADA